MVSFVFRSIKFRYLLSILATSLAKDHVCVILILSHRLRNLYDVIMVLRNNQKSPNSVGLERCVGFACARFEKIDANL